MSTKRKAVKPQPADEAPRIRRAYFDCRYGQLHVNTAFPVGGGFDEHPTLICLHGTGLSSRVFRPFMEEIGRDRSVYAPDLPGCGESDAPSSKPAIQDYAASIADFLDQMRFRQVDLLGHHTGSLIAAELAFARPQVVRRIALVGIPILETSERANWARSVAAIAATPDGSHLAAEWKRTADHRNAAELAATVEDFSIRLHNGASGAWMMNAVAGYAASERLALVAQPALLMRARDAFWEASLRAKSWIRNLKVIDLPESDEGVFRSAPKVVATHLRSFLDRGA